MKRSHAIDRPEYWLSAIQLAVAAVVSVLGIDLPLGFYAAAWGMFAFLCFRLFASSRVLSAVYGCTFVAMLGYAIAFDVYPTKAFSPLYPAMVYIPEYVQLAYHSLFTAGSVFFFVCFRSEISGNWRWGDPSQAERRTARWLVPRLFVVAVVLSFLLSSGVSITQAVYASEEYLSKKSLVESAGVALIGLATIAAIPVAAARSWGVNSLYFKVVLLLVTAHTVWFRLMRGERTGILTFIATVAAIYWFERRKPGMVWRSVAALLVGVAIIQVWPYVRGSASSVGLAEAISSGVQENVTSLGSGGGPQFDPTSITMLPQSYFHLLHCISLREEGISLNGLGFWYLIPQSIPSDLAKLLGYERPLNAAWRLAEYRIHAGGMYIIAEGYWELGLVGSALVAALMGISANWFERYCRRSPPVVSFCYILLLGGSAFGVFYGLQSFVKSIEVVALMAVSYSWLVRFRERRTLRASGRSLQKRLPEGTTAAVGPA